MIYCKAHFTAELKSQIELIFQLILINNFKLYASLANNDSLSRNKCTLKILFFSQNKLDFNTFLWKS